MNHHQRQVATPAKRAISILLSMLMCAESGIAFAQYTGPGAIPISNTPVGVGLTGAKPNFLVTLDDSGSTNWEFMPGERQEWRHNYAGMYSRACNTIFFDPDGQYPLPPDPSDVSKTLDRPSGSELPLDGFGASSGTMNVAASFQLGTPNLGDSWVPDEVVVPAREFFYYQWNIVAFPAGPTGLDCRTRINPGAVNDGLDPGKWTRVTWSTLDGTKRDKFRSWFTYYRTRLNVLKSSAGQAFATASDGLRIGLITTSPWKTGDKARKVDGERYLPIADFNASQRKKWLKKLYGLVADPNAQTPLLEALSRAGRHFAGINTGINEGMDEDPQQYSCQRNYSLLATDGYWNVDWNNVLKSDETVGYSWRLDGRGIDPKTDGVGTPKPFFDGFVNEYRRWSVPALDYTNNGQLTNYCSDQRITDPDHPQRGEKFVRDARGVEQPAFLEYQLKKDTYFKRAMRPKGYDDVFPIEGPEADWKSYNKWLNARDEPGRPENASDLAAARTLLSNEKPYESPRTTYESNGVKKVYTRKVKHEYQKINDVDGSTMVCALLDYSCPAAGDGNLQPCGSAATTPLGYYTPTISSSGEYGPVKKEPDQPLSPAYATLADVAMYYYKNDLRTGSLNPKNRQTGREVFANTVQQGQEVDTTKWATDVKDTAPHQHMTTFTLGMGVAGWMQYDQNYQAQTDANDMKQDYARIVAGAQGWPDPYLGDVDPRVKADDLWHAAVNGRGLYMSANDPNQLFASLAKVLRSITTTTSGGSAAATTTTRLTSTDRTVYSTNYVAGDWSGDLTKGLLDLTTFRIENDPVSAASRLQQRVGQACDSRTIYVMRSNRRGEFSWDTRQCAADGTPKSGGGANGLSSGGTLTDADRTWLKSKLSSSGYSFGTSLGKTPLEASDLVNFLRGQWGREARDANDPKNQWFRNRTGVKDGLVKPLGDIISSQPVYVKAPPLAYVDQGYLDGASGGTAVPGYKTANANRTGMVYVGGNDGMLHAFNGDTLNEEWALVPSLVVPDMYRLANHSYSLDHHYFIDGSPVVGDIYDSAASGSTADKWKTLLVGGLNAGGAGFYAIDVTTPNDPKPMWEFTCDSNRAKGSDGQCDLGLSFGEPVITKRPDGKWVTLLSSGYNSESGRAVLFVVDAANGAVLSKHVASVGSSPVGAPSNQAGLAKIAAWAENALRDNTSHYAYGGDLAGRMWKFDIGTADAAPILLATLTDSQSPAKAQSITTAPDLAFDPDTQRRMVFVATGRYLDESDTSSSVKESVWGLVDHSTSTPIDRLGVTPCAIAVDGEKRTSSCSNQVSSAKGWVIDLPLAKERVTVNPIVRRGALIFASNAPTTTDVCEPKGESYLYYVDISNGGAIPAAPGGRVGQSLGSTLAVGLSVVDVNGTTKALLGDDKGGQSVKDPFTKSGSAEGKRVSWRELIR